MIEDLLSLATHLHVGAEGGVGAKENLTLLVRAVVHARQFGRQTHQVATPRVRVQQASAGL